MQQNSANITEPIKSVSENVESVRNRIAKASNTTSPGGIDSDELTGQINPETIFGELQNLRKKYDAVVEYTVHLTAERDLMVQRLEQAERDAREVLRRNKNSNSIESPKASKKSDKIEKKSMMKVSRYL